MKTLVDHAHLIGKSLEQITQADVREWIVSRIGGVSPETINGNIRVWRVFYNWLLDEGDIDASLNLSRHTMIDHSAFTLDLGVRFYWGGQ